MAKEIPIYFDNVVIMAPSQRIGETNSNSLKVGVFTKYKNRNGSYITDAVADQLIASATKGTTPVVGFFDRESQDWSSHTGPTLANAYGWVKSFEGWQPFQDTDGVVRDYAVFEVMLFNEYYDEANYIVGQNQSMELNIKTIEGDWADIDGNEYFVYTKASILGLCIIGKHEPCFSVSSFFSKQDSNYETQYDKFSSLLTEFKARIEEAQHNPEGGEHQMENVLTPEVNNEPTPAQEFEQVPEAPEQEAPAAEEPATEPELAAEEPAVEEVPEAEAEPEAESEEAPAETEAEPTEDEGEQEPAVDFEAQIAELQNQLNEMTTNYENAQNRIAELEAQITSASETETSLREQIATYEAEHAHIEVEKKSSLLNKYENLLSEEEISPLRTELENFSYAELESKLAICYANKQMAGNDNHTIPLPEPNVDDFAVFMEKYRKY